MIFREATIADIDELMTIRNSVTENALSDPALVPYKDYEEFMFRRGKGWLCETEGKIAGFAIADLVDNNVWALFMRAEYEGRGIGKELHKMMLDWYFSQTETTL